MIMLVHAQGGKSRGATNASTSSGGSPTTPNRGRQLPTSASSRGYIARRSNARFAKRLTEVEDGLRRHGGGTVTVYGRGTRRQIQGISSDGRYEIGVPLAGLVTYPHLRRTTGRYRVK